MITLSLCNISTRSPIFRHESKPFGRIPISYLVASPLGEFDQRVNYPLSCRSSDTLHEFIVGLRDSADWVLPVVVGFVMAFWCFSNVGCIM